MHLHILGICGTFMGGLALLARAAGHRVTGCDANVYPPMSTQLAAQGIELIEGWNADQARLAPDVFVIGRSTSIGLAASIGMGMVSSHFHELIPTPYAKTPPAPPSQGGDEGRGG